LLAKRQFDDGLFLATSETGRARCGDERMRSWRALASESDSDRECGCGRAWNEGSIGDIVRGWRDSAVRKSPMESSRRNIENAHGTPNAWPDCSANRTFHCNPLEVSKPGGAVPAAGSWLPACGSRTHTHNADGRYRHSAGPRLDPPIGCPQGGAHAWGKL